jgi:anti-anti-sigma factor
MEIEDRPLAHEIEVVVRGRLDSRWADHLKEHLASVLRSGQHQVALDLSGITFVSSAGLRVLIQFLKEIRALRGSVRLSALSEECRTVLDLSGTLDLFSAPTERSQPDSPTKPLGRSYQSANAEWLIDEVADTAPLTVEFWGKSTTSTDAEPLKIIQATPGFFALGLGALGSPDSETSARLGEWLLADGVIAYLPTDGADLPDYSVASGSFIPAAVSPRGLSFSGPLSHRVSFNSLPPSGRVGWSEVMVNCLDQLGWESAVFAMAAESAGLVGACLKRPPGPDPTSKSFSFPQIRDTLMFTSERAFPRALVFAIGLVSRKQGHPLLRPLGRTSKLSHHTHAVTFPYRPLPQSGLELRPWLHHLFSEHMPTGLLHLLNDDRETEGIGESEWTRGTLWLAPATWEETSP